jgi:hypothetical protein
MSVKEMTSTFLSVLDSEDVITKLAKILSTSINLIFDEKITLVVSKLDGLISDVKSMQKRIVDVEQANEKLKQVNDGLHATIDNLTLRVNQLEQNGRKNNIVITGIPETYAERATPAGDGEDDSQPQVTREDTVKTVCSAIKDACNVVVVPEDIQSAFRLRSRGNGPRPILVTFNSYNLRTSVVRARRPKQQLRYKGSNIYINDHLTKFNTDLSYKARQTVKNKFAHSTWVRDGLVFIKWSSTDNHPTQLRCMADLN